MNFLIGTGWTERASVFDGFIDGDIKGQGWHIGIQLFEGGLETRHSSTTWSVVSQPGVEFDAQIS
jgi:hypothetical protein